MFPTFIGPEPTVCRMLVCDYAIESRRYRADRDRRRTGVFREGPDVHGRGRLGRCVITDTSGGRIPGAPARLREVGTHREREATTDEQGAFRVPELQPGIYDLSVTVPGFAPYQHTGILVALGSTVRLEIELQSALVQTQVTVSGQPPPIDPAQTGVSSAVDTERIEELPVQSRNYLNFVLLAPGVS